MTDDMPSRAPRPASGVARGSLGTGTAVDDDTQVYRAPAITWRPSVPGNSVADQPPRLAADATPAPAPAAPAPAPGAMRFGATRPVDLRDTSDHAPTAPVPVRRPARRARGRGAGRTLSVALAVVLVALLGVAMFGAIGQRPGAGSDAVPTEQVAGKDGARTNDDGGDAGDAGRAGGGGNNGRGNDNGNRGNNGRGNGNGHDDD
jgi:hypothetical protein